MPARTGGGCNLAGNDKVLIVGGGIGGMSCAISLRRAGISVDLVEIDPAWKIYGAGITITGPTLRALQTLGVLDEIKQYGATWQGARVFTQSGDLIEELTSPLLGGGLPGNGGIMRPELHRILSTRTLATGAHVRLGTTVETLAQDPEGVAVKLTNGHREHYSLVVGADGIYSKLRERVFPEAPRPKFTGQVVYRIVAERTAGFDRTCFYMGPDSKLGFNPVSRTHMYMFLLQRSPANPWIAVEDQAQRLYEAMAGWGGIVPEVRAKVLTVNAHTINYRPLEAVLLPNPWYRGRVVLIGDAAHATTPHLASGAGMAVEDGIVLAEEIARDGNFDAALPRFMQRRFERGKLVVEKSLRLGELEMTHGSLTEYSRVMRTAAEALALPA
jgi:2-polyprenyl-6-methoxyphenol hydroxylase-like FAD-dependent oxidoreductase